ncbi:MAG: RtcB family protein, partial [Clostridia bacterium]|nr:RtcB family protein [Clostridia bacterium]
VDKFDFSKLNCLSSINYNRAIRSIGTLGGGNHFIELDKAENGDLILIIHSGSRQVGSDVALYYQDLAFREACKKERKQSRDMRYKALNEEEYYCKSVRREAKAKLNTTRQNAILKGERFLQYLNDVSIIQEYADLNRRTIAERICTAMQLHIKDRFSCVHNYIDKESMILRKGAISARQNERVIIPLNMRDGSILGVGLGNPEWNFSAPHGAGRSCSRTETRYTYTVEEYQKAMTGIYTTTANIGSLDECPMAYKPPQKIIDAVKETVEIQQIICPIYNFKAC